MPGGPETRYAHRRASSIEVGRERIELRLFVGFLLGIGSLVFSGCSSSAAGGRLDDPASVVEVWSVELVVEDDPRVAAIDPLPLEDDGLLTVVSGGGTRYEILVPATCPVLPDLRVRPAGQRIELAVVDPPEQLPCVDADFVYLDVHLVREFREVSTSRGG